MRILRFDSCTSTNDILKAEQGDFVVAVADKQTAGRGQRGNTWISDSGKNLLFSILVTPGQLNVGDAFVLSQGIALSICNVLVHYIPEGRVSVKWPNDIYVDRRKICGILIENDLQGRRVTRSIIGCGINVNQVSFPDGLAAPATSVAMESGEEMSCETVLRDVTDAFARTYADICAGHYEDIRAQYHEHLFFRGVHARYEDKDGEFDGVISHVENDGHLIIKDAEGGLRRYAFKEIKLKL
jgi:BirA family biotin operon repressor/biotin-[acetyl-CoA-carboxylase] ligase